MSAEVLRQAASLMRERAEVASAPPWEAGWKCVWALNDDAVISDGDSGDGGCLNGDDATHIASWHPAVALAVADWLEIVANYGRGTRNYDAAVAVARAYLGSDQ